MLPITGFVILFYFHMADEMNSLVERESGDELREWSEPISEENDRRCWNLLKVLILIHGGLVFLAAFTNNAENS